MQFSVYFLHLTLVMNNYLLNVWYILMKMKINLPSFFVALHVANGCAYFWNPGVMIHLYHLNKNCNSKHTAIKLVVVMHV
jgi:hypothetical protein